MKQFPVAYATDRKDGFGLKLQFFRSIPIILSCLQKLPKNDILMLPDEIRLIYSS